MAPVADADLLRHLIEAKGVSQADVARETGIAESTISEVLGGQADREPDPYRQAGPLLPC
jgi:HTH-type transcriptional regulator/antitoxin HigA